MNPTGAPPPVYCPDFALLPTAEHAGKSRIAFSRAVNLMSPAQASADISAAAAPRIIVLNVDGQLYVRDLARTARLERNGNPVTEAALQHGDRLRLGKVEYEVSAPNCAPTAATPPDIDAELEPVGGAARQRLRPPITLIDPSAQADVRVPGNGSGPQPCTLLIRLGASYWLWNVNPTAEARVNGAPVVRARIADGSTLHVGGAEFRFRLVTPPAGPVAAVTPPPPKNAEAPLPAPVPPAPAPVPAPPATTVPTPAASSAPVVSAQKPQSLASRRKQADTFTQDDADSLKRWGPLAFAVAAADRPELQGIDLPATPEGSPITTDPAPTEGGDDAPKGRLRATILIVLLILTIIAGGAYVAWKYLPRPPT